MCNTYIVRLWYTCNSFRGASDVRYSRCRNRARVGLSVGISVTVSVPSNKVRVVVVLTKNVVKIISLIFTLLRVKVPGKSLYFSTIGLGKQSTEKKNLSFSLIHHFHTCCAIFWFEYSICVIPRQRCACASIFSSHIFFVFCSPNCSSSFFVFLWISRKINPLNAKTISYFSEWACIFRFTCLSVVETAKKLEKYRMLGGKMIMKEGRFWRQEMKGKTRTPDLSS